MKKWLLMLAGIATVLFWPRQSSAGMDVGKLQPVQVVLLSRSDSNVAVRTDTGDWGVGSNLTEAVENMKLASAGEIFLETADYLLLEPECLPLLDAAADILRPSCHLCLLNGEPDMDKIGQFLEFHSPEITLMEYRAGLRRLQTLKTTEGRMTLVS